MTTYRIYRDHLSATEDVPDDYAEAYRAAVERAIGHEAVLIDNVSGVGTGCDADCREEHTEIAQVIWDRQEFARNSR